MVMLICNVAFVSIFLIIDFFQKIDNFIDAGVSNSIMILYFLYKIPYILFQMMPVALLIASIVLFSSMKKHKEIVAMKASGLNILVLSRPLIGVSLCAVLFSFLISETIVPITSSKSNEIWDIDVEKQDPSRFYGRNTIWFKSKNAIYWMKVFDPENARIDSVSFYFFDNSFRMHKRIDALRCIWDNSKWQMEEGIIQELNEDGKYSLRRFDKLDIDIPETPETFIRREKSPEEMSYWQLKRYAEKVKGEGYDNMKYLTDKDVKLALPFACLILTLLGMPVALYLKKGGAPMAVSVGVGLCFLYTLALGLLRSLGLSGVLPPILSAWLANIIFLLFAVYLMLNLER